MKVHIISKVVVLVAVLFINACSSRGPMESFFGPIATPNYTKLLKGSIIEANEKLLSASEGTSAAGIRALGGAVLLTDSRLLFAQWSSDLLKYSTVYSIRIEDIKSYGMCHPFGSTLSLAGKVFCVQGEDEEIMFATEQVNSIFYNIKKSNPTAVRTDS